MKLVDLVEYFKEGGSYADFCELHSLNINSEVVEVYMRMPLKTDNELAFFEVENTEGMSKIENKGLLFFNLFDFYFSYV